MTTTYPHAGHVHADLEMSAGHAGSATGVEPLLSKSSATKRSWIPLSSQRARGRM